MAGTELHLENVHRSKLNSKVSSKHVTMITEQYFSNQQLSTASCVAGTGTSSDITVSTLPELSAQERDSQKMLSERRTVERPDRGGERGPSEGRRPQMELSSGSDPREKWGSLGRLPQGSRCVLRSGADIGRTLRPEGLVGSRVRRHPLKGTGLTCKP